jgi:hypothetical protein
MELFDKYFEIQKQIYDFFGYKEDWCVIPLDNNCDKYWRLEGEGPGGELHYADSIKELEDQDGNYYVDSIYTQRFLPKWVYRGEGFTMVCCDTHTDGNKFLRILDNKKESK